MQFAEPDKAECLQSATDVAGTQSYVELLTCLEVAQDAPPAVAVIAEGRESRRTRIGPRPA